jgi:hypothetical protein
MKRGLFFMLFLICFSVKGVEIPIPSLMYPVELFSSTREGEFVVGSHHIELKGTSYYDTRFWLKTKGGQFTGDPQNKVFEFSYYPYSYGTQDVDYFLWDSNERPHFIRSSSSGGHGSETYYSSSWVGYLWPETAFTMHYLYRKSNYYFWDYIDYESINTEYSFTREGEYISCGNHYSYEWNMAFLPPLYQEQHSFEIESSIGFSKTYTNVNLDGIIPRINPNTGTCHFLRIKGGIYKYLFGANIESKLIYQGEHSIKYMDFQPDPSDRLHIIWKEYENTVRYGILEGESFSSEILTVSEYNDNFRIVMNTKGDILLYNKGTDGYLSIWTRYHDSSAWSLETLFVAANLKDGFINEEGGISVLCYESDSPDIHFFHSSKRGEPIHYSAYTIESGEKIKHSFCEDGNFGFLVKRPDGTYYIFVNEPSFGSPSVPITAWIFY